MKLIDRFMIAPIDGITWKIYDKNTHRKLSDNYGAERDDVPYDNMRVWSIGVKTDKNGKKYYRVSVY